MNEKHDKKAQKEFGITNQHHLEDDLLAKFACGQVFTEFGAQIPIQFG